MDSFLITTILLQGFLVGLAYVVPIGMQNLYVIHSATNFSSMKVLQVVVATVIFDIALAFATFYGVGLLMEHHLWLRILLLIIGGMAVIYIGVTLIRSHHKQSIHIAAPPSFLKILVSCFSATWLNPQALIDGTLFLGSLRASLPDHTAHFFIFGVCLASAAWFTFVATITYRLKRFLSPKILNIIQTICGIVLIAFGLKLFFTLLDYL